jgi:hypothetical protein
MILFAKERRHLPQKSHPILCCGRNLTEGYAPSTYTNKNSTSSHQVGLSAQGLYRNKGLVRWSLSVGLILVKPFLPQELNMPYKSNGWLLHIKKFPMIPSGYPSDTDWVSWENTMMGFYKNVMPTFTSIIFSENALAIYIR